MLIQKNTVNTCFFTLAERTTLDPVYYLFEFTNQQDESTKVFLASDISINKLRGNEFQIEETETEDLTLGKINLDLLEGWTYKIYEQSSSSNLDLTLTGSLVEIGRVDVKGPEVTDETFTSTSTIRVFND